MTESECRFIIQPQLISVNLKTVRQSALTARGVDTRLNQRFGQKMGEGGTRLLLLCHRRAPTRLGSFAAKMLLRHGSAALVQMLTP